MAFLDQKERIFDIVLTDHGRELMSKNQLNFVYFAFSDESVDYSGSLSASAINSSTLESYLFRNLPFEADQRKDFNKQRDLASYLYTIPIRDEILPEFKISHNTGSDLILERRFFIDTLTFYNRPRSYTQRPIDVILRANIPTRTMRDRQEDYVISQRIRDLKTREKDVNFNAVGLPLGKNLTLVSKTKVLDKETGNVLDINSQAVKSKIEEPSLKTLSVKREAEFVVGVDSAKVEFSLANSKGTFESQGFLIEIFDSGSDGRLTRLYREDLVDAVNDSSLSDGFTNYVRLRVDG